MSKNIGSQIGKLDAKTDEVNKLEKYTIAMTWRMTIL
jgi:hypothetical protein